MERLPSYAPETPGDGPQGYGNSAKRMTRRASSRIRRPARAADKLKTPLACSLTTGLRTSPALAVRIHVDGDQYVCPHLGCRLRLCLKVRSKTGTAFFAGISRKPAGHIADCPYDSPRRIATGAGRSPARRHENAEHPDAFIPDRLSSPPLPRYDALVARSDEDIDRIVAAAEDAGMPGNLEEIVTARENLIERAAQVPLAINGVGGTYASRFRPIEDLEFPWREDEWSAHIVIIKCTATQGDVAGFTFLNSLSAFGGIKPSLTLDLRPTKGLQSKAYLSALLARDDSGIGRRLSLFWQGSPPRAGSRKLEPSPPLGLRFAVRLAQST